MTVANIRQPLRMLLLPMRTGTEGACGRALKSSLAALGVSPEDYLNWVSVNLENWRTLGNPQPDFQKVVRRLIEVTAEQAPVATRTQSALLAREYFNIHSSLVSRHFMTHEEAIAFLSHAYLMGYLADSEKLTAAQIANILGKRDLRVKFNRQSVGELLSEMGLSPGLSRQHIQSLYQRDTSREAIEFADADLLGAAEIIAEVGVALGFPGDLLRSLKALMPFEHDRQIISPFTPYLQMLHYQCSIAEYFDHALTDVYEFSPRGEACLHLLTLYPANIAGAGNPFLNNAKSVDAVDFSWVRSKKNRERPGAMALFELLNGLQSMSFSSRRELAWWIRLWLCRIIRIASADPIPFPISLTNLHCEQLLEAVKRGNTETLGIIEQRIVDAISLTRHKDWRSRGIGDAVNATNISRSKLGDCDFLDPDSKEIIAYESHGGMLSEIYVNQHLATLEKSIPRRIEELSAIADLDQWKVSIVFVAHSIKGPIKNRTKIHGLEIEIATLEFRDFIAMHAPAPNQEIIDNINNILLKPFLERKIPNVAKRKLLKIIGM
ncbi:hypothetical protein [Achromobacter sp.]|uniref:hypothetical protein n=1 Tax=Achromobacter sp. TaxID=134375 RepID=UPI003C71E53B